VRPPRGSDVWLKLPSSVRAPCALKPPARNGPKGA